VSENAPAGVPDVPGLTGLASSRGAVTPRSTGHGRTRWVARVAVKVEHRTLDSDRDQRRFVREAKAAGQMSSHPHVVDLYDVGVTDDGHPFLIMELCDGTYADRLKQGHCRMWRLATWARRSPMRSPTPTRSACCTATSSRPTSS
jgi:serine/threonine protein kinase